METQFSIWFFPGLGTTSLIKQPEEKKLTLHIVIFRVKNITLRTRRGSLKWNELARCADSDTRVAKKRRTPIDLRKINSLRSGSRSFFRERDFQNFFKVSVSLGRPSYLS